MTPPVASGRVAPAPWPSDEFAAAANPLGLLDLVGNVWQLTDDEMEDEHTRFVVVRGGSRYQPQAANPQWMGGQARNWYFPSVGNRLDRYSKAILMDEAFDRASTVGFRCAYDRVPAAPEHTHLHTPPA